MTNRPKQIGTAAETAVARFLAGHGWPSAERRALRGTLDCGDITGTPGVCWEVKGGHAAEQASDGQVALWLAETETERVNSGAAVGVLVLKRKGISASRAGEWWAVLWLEQLAVLVDPCSWTPETHSYAHVRLHLDDACHLLHAAGYGDAPERAA